MMRRTSLVSLLAACAGTTPPPSTPPGQSTANPQPVAAPAAASSPAAAAAEDEADLRFLSDLAHTRKYTLGRATRPRFLPDGSQVLFLRATARSPVQSLYAFDVQSGQIREVISPAEVLKGSEEKLGPEERARRERMRVSASGFTAFEIAHDGRKVLLLLGGRIFVVPVATATADAGGGAGGGASAIEVAAPDAEGRTPFDPHFSPDGSQVAFVRGNALWVAPVGGGAARALAKSPGRDVGIAQAEFVAQEEMDRYAGYWWSPDGSLVAYEQWDAAPVEKLFVGDPADPTADAGPTPYPRPGHPNVDVALFVVAARGGKPTAVTWDKARFPYLTDVQWDEGGPLALTVMSRDQKDLVLLAADAKAGKTTVLLREHDDVWLNLHPPGSRTFATEQSAAAAGHRWLGDGSGFLWTTERNGAWQLELHAADGKLVRALTTPELGLFGIRKVDLSSRTVVVAAAPEPLTPADQAIDAQFARSGGAALYVRSAVDQVYDPEVRRADGSVAGVLASVAEKTPLAPRVEIQKLGPAPGYWTSIVRPRDFDPKKKYPVIVEVYGGPHTTVVHRALLGYVESQFIADHGFIVVSVDNKGTPGRGRAWERELFGKLGDLPLEGQVLGLEALAQKEPAMDLGRVGIFGHSFGGFLSAYAVMRRPDVYRAAVASAPVSDWLEYDTFYTERYLGVPDLRTHELYDKNGLLDYAKDLTRPLLIIHGTADDNVHMVHSLKLVDALFRAGRPYDFLTLAHSTHAPREPALLLRYYQRIFDFLRRNL